MQQCAQSHTWSVKVATTGNVKNLATDSNIDRVLQGGAVVVAQLLQGELAQDNRLLPAEHQRWWRRSDELRQQPDIEEDQDLLGPAQTEQTQAPVVRPHPMNSLRKVLLQNVPSSAGC